MAKNRYNKSKKLFKSNKNKRHQLTKKKPFQLTKLLRMDGLVWEKRYLN